MLHYGPVSGNVNEHAQGEGSSRYDNVENGRELLDFPLSMKLGKINFQRDSQQGKEKKMTMPSETACACLCKYVCLRASA